MQRKRPRLELYVDTIEALSNNGPTNPSKLTLKTKINSSPLKTILRDMEGKKLVEERKIETNLFYAATTLARAILLHYRELNSLILSK